MVGNFFFFFFYFIIWDKHFIPNTNTSVDNDSRYLKGYFISGLIVLMSLGLKRGQGDPCIWGVNNVRTSPTLGQGVMR